MMGIKKQKAMWSLGEFLITTAAVAIFTSLTTGVIVYKVLTPETHGVCRTAMKDIWMDSKDHSYFTYQKASKFPPSVEFLSNEVVQTYTVECEVRIPVSTDWPQVRP